MTDVPSPLECTACGEPLAPGATQCPMCGSVSLRAGNPPPRAAPDTWIVQGVRVLVVFGLMAATAQFAPGLAICVGGFAAVVVSVSASFAAFRTRTDPNFAARSLRSRLLSELGYAVLATLVFAASVVAFVLVCSATVRPNFH
jgi:F0F1-type ATP synthase assembly protein I